MFERKIIKRIPGILPERHKSEKQGYIDNLSNKSKPELLELLERQKKLLDNGSFIKKLPDKGVKIKELYDKILYEISLKDSMEQLGSNFSGLSLKNKQKELDDLEWGKENSDQVIDSDDDEDEKDPLKIIAQSTDTTKKLRTLKKEKELITETDIQEIKSFSVDNEEATEKHTIFLICKEQHSKVQKQKFKPYHTTKTDVHDPSKEALRKSKGKWENTAATPPPSVHGPTKLLSLQESLSLRKQQSENLKEVELKHAAEKLAEQLGMPSKLSNSSLNITGTYRQPKIHSADASDEEQALDSDDEICDDNEDHRGTISYTVTEWSTK